jgi:hypothetical protein
MRRLLREIKIRVVKRVMLETSFLLFFWKGRKCQLSGIISDAGCAVTPIPRT